MNEIAKQLRVSKHSVSSVCSRALSKGLTSERIREMADIEVYAFLYPEKEGANTLYTEVDYDRVTSELMRVLRWK